MGPVEASLVHNYDDIRRKFFPPSHAQKQTRSEAEMLAKIHELQIAYVSVSNRLSTEEKNHLSTIKRLELLEDLIRPEFLDEDNPPPKIISIFSIMQLVCKTEGISTSDARSMRRTADVCRIRHIIYYLASTLTLLSLPQIGRLVGKRDHTTVFHGREKIKRLRASQPELDAKLKWYEQTLTGTADGSDNASHPAG